MTPPSELEKLKIAVALFGDSEAQAEAIAPHLREARSALIDELERLEAQALRRRFEGE